MSVRRVYVISVAAELAGMHPQTLRQYDREGLVQPIRTSGGGRRYTDENVDQLREVQRLSQREGVNLAGIRRILSLQTEVDALRDENEALRRVTEELAQFERNVSARRRAMFDRIDALQAEIVRRYRSGEANVDSLLGR